MADVFVDSDGVLATLVNAGMLASAKAALLDGDPDDAIPHREVAHDIVHLAATYYGTVQLFIALSSMASKGLLMTRDLTQTSAVAAGEVEFTRLEEVWTFSVRPIEDERTADGILRAAQLVTVYANLIDQIGEGWSGSENFTPSPGVISDGEAWKSLYEAIPQSERCFTARSLMTICGLVFDGMTIPGGRR